MAHRPGGRSAEGHAAGFTQWQLTGIAGRAGSPARGARLWAAGQSSPPLGCACICATRSPTTGAEELSRDQLSPVEARSTVPRLGRVPSWASRAAGRMPPLASSQATPTIHSKARALASKVSASSSRQLGGGDSTGRTTHRSTVETFLEQLRSVRGASGSSGCTSAPGAGCWRSNGATKPGRAREPRLNSTPTTPPRWAKET